MSTRKGKKDRKPKPSSGGSVGWGNFGGSAQPGEDEGDELEIQRVEEQLERASAEFNRQLLAGEKALAHSKTSEHRAALELGRSRMLLLWSWVELRFRLLRLGDVEATQTFLWRWLRQTCDLQVTQEQKRHLDEQVCGVAAACALWLLEAPSQLNDPGNPPKQVHRFLARYFSALLEPADVIRAARTWLESEQGRALTSHRVEQALGALELVLSEPVEQQVLAQVFRDGLPAHEDLVRQVFGDGALPELRRMLQPAPSGVRYSRVNPRSLHGCPSCNRSLLGRPNAEGIPMLDSDVNWKLRQHAYVKCPSCQHFLVSQECV